MTAHATKTPRVVSKETPHSTAIAAVGSAAAVYLPLDHLKPNPKNPRLHGDDVVALARTIVRTTWGAPIVAQSRSGRVIGGHGRLEAAKLILAGIEVDGELRGGSDHYFDKSAPGPALVPVRLVDVSDAEADAMTLADNARRLQGRDDPAALVAMATASFERNAPTMIDMGLGADDLDALVKQAGDAVLASAQTAGDDAERAPRDDSPATAPGDTRKAFVGGYAVAVMCRDEAHQQEIFDALKGYGFDDLKVLAL